MPVSAKSRHLGTRRLRKRTTVRTDRCLESGIRRVGIIGGISRESWTALITLGEGANRSIACKDGLILPSLEH